MGATLGQYGITFSDGSIQNTAAGFDAGTTMTFQQATAPTGWTKVTDHNDKALRIVNGTPGSGGSVSFSSFGSQTIGQTTLSVSQMPSHNHYYSAQSKLPSEGVGAYWAMGGYNYGSATGYMSYSGGNSSHTHSLNMDIQYVDLILASKN